MKSDLASDVGVTPAAIGQFERGVMGPRPSTLARLAVALSVPIDFFLLRPSLHIAEGDAHFRSLRSTAKRDRDQARATLELLAEMIEWLERSLRLPTLNFPHLDAHLEPEQAAKEAREAWSLGLGPVSNVVGLLERRGSIVARLHADSDSIDAFSCWLAGRPYVLLTSNKTSAERSRFDAAHELGHLLQHHDAEPGAQRTEALAHRFAAEFLMPAATMVEELPTRLDWRRYLELKLRWGTSLAALVRRAHDLGRISEYSYRRAMVEIGRRGWRVREPDVGRKAETPELLRRALELLEGRFDIGLEEIAEAVHVSHADATRLASMTAAIDERVQVVPT